MARKKGTGRDTDADYETEAEVDAAEDAERDEHEAKVVERDRGAVVSDRGAVVSDQVEAAEAERAAAVREQVAGQPYEGRATLELLETTDVEDIQALSDALVEVIQGSAYDDMTWNEIDHALRRTSHAIRQNWSATGTVKAAPPPEDARGLAARDERDGLRSSEEKPRYAG